MKNVKMLGRVCPFCKLRYCNSHAMAEQHGCGADAKVRVERVCAGGQLPEDLCKGCAQGS
jgi:predicted nucleic acid binding AN1-type Zn finger protein